jgi:hypothetical protein
VVSDDRDHSSGFCGLFRIPHRDVIIDGRRFFYWFASTTLRGFFDWRIRSSRLRLRRFAGTSWGWFFGMIFPLRVGCRHAKYPLGLMEGATEHSAVVQALIDDLIERGLDPAVPRLFRHAGFRAA